MNTHMALHERQMDVTSEYVIQLVIIGPHRRCVPILLQAAT